MQSIQTKEKADVYTPKRIFNPLINLCALLMLFSACAKEETVEKHYDARSNVIHVKSLMHEIEMEEPPISMWGAPVIVNDYLVVGDLKSYDGLVHVFDRKTFKYLASAGTFGQGPSELSNMGETIPVEARNSVYVVDHGSQNIYEFQIDSMLQNPHYLPSSRGKINGMQFPIFTHYVNDTLSYALIADVLNFNDYHPRTARYNLLTGKIECTEYAGHPEIERKRISMAASPENNLYAEVYWYHDLVTLHSLDGKLKHILYGAKWNNQKSSKNEYFSHPLFCKDKLIIPYVGGERFIKKNGKETSVYPTKLVVFDLEGNYMETLETEYEIMQLCYDPYSDRLIFSLNADMQFAYLDLKSVPGLGKK